MFINRHLIAFARGNVRYVAKTCTLQLLLTLLGTLTALGFAFAVRMIQGENQILVFDSLWQVFLCIFLCVLLRYNLMRIKSASAEQCGLRIKTSLRERLLNKLFTLGPEYGGRSRTGETASSIGTKVEHLNEYYTIYFPAVVSAIFNAILIISVIYMFNALTAQLCILACAGLLGCPMLFYFVMRERGAREMQAHASYYSDCLDSIQGMVTLKAFHANERQKGRIHQMGEKLRQAVMEQLRITMLENVVLQFFLGIGSVISIAAAAWQCTLGKVSQENLVYVLFLVSACFSPMNQLINAWHMGYRGVTASYSIVKLLLDPPRFALAVPEQQEDIKYVHDFSGDIQFSHVSFAYDEKEGDVLKDVSFGIPNRTVTALVGISGSGKSTIAQLLAGFYPVREGTISVGEEVISQNNVSQIQNMISAVWQDSHLFYGSAEDNIRMGNPMAGREEIEFAAREANIHDFIMGLPNGYGTMLGERGMRLSGGERQRVALARAFLRNAPIVILDEATSSLDGKNELEIQESFKKLSRGRTVLVIAHRLATIRNADQIVILERGKIQAVGTHQELERTSELYRRLMGSQMAGGEA